jgi:hypothetical protein
VAAGSYYCYASLYFISSATSGNNVELSFSGPSSSSFFSQGVYAANGAASTSPQQSIASSGLLGAEPMFEIFPWNADNSASGIRFTCDTAVTFTAAGTFEMTTQCAGSTGFTIAGGAFVLYPAG